MALIIGGAGAPLAFSSASGGKIYAFNTISTVAQQVVAANPSRTKLTFHNPGDADIFIGPTTVLVSGAATTFSPTTAAYGGCFRVFANGGTLVIEGECQGAWQAFSASGSDKPLTVMDSNL